MQGRTSAHDLKSAQQITHGKRTKRRGGSDLYTTKVATLRILTGGSGYDGRTLFRRELASFLNEVSE